MARYSDNSVRSDLYSPQSPNALLPFAVVSHDNLPEPLRFVSDPLDFVLDGETYLGCPFSIRLLSDNDKTPVATLVVNSVTRKMSSLLKQVKGRVKLKLELRSTADFDLSVVPRVSVGTVQPLYSFNHFELIDITCNPIQVTAKVILRDYSQEPWPGQRATQSRCPGLFR